MSFNHQAKLAFEAVKRLTSQIQATAINTGQRLTGIEDSLRPQQSWYNFTGTGAVSPRHGLGLDVPEHMDHPVSRSHYLETLNIENALMEELGEEADIKNQAKSALPASSFELATTFRPEIYTSFNAGSSLFCYAGHQEQDIGFTRVNRYEMMYSSKPREFTRVSVSVTISVESRWYSVTAPVATVGFAWRRQQSLPARLHSAIERILKSRPTLTQDSHLRIYLGSRSDLDDLEGSSTVPVEICTSMRNEAYLRIITDMLHHLNMPWYFETDLIPFPLPQNTSNVNFISFWESRWVLDNRFESLSEQIDWKLYELRVLHSLRGVPRINPFIGAVVNQSSGIVKGFLSELPAKRQLLATIRRICESGKLVEWKRCAKWCRQLVQGVAEVHGKGLLVGILGDEMKDGVGIDEQDNVVLYHFRPVFYYGNPGKDSLPPEYRRSASAEGVLTALPQTDIYQLGLFLWRMMGYEYSQPATDLGEDRGRTMKVNAAAYSDPFELPPTGKHVPQYLRDVICACHNEDPRQRPPAWKLLKMFPAQAEEGLDSPGLAGLEDGPTSRFQKQPTSIPMDELRQRRNFCDICRKIISDHYFHCNRCYQGDFDICASCLSRGQHCMDDKHYLHEFVAKRSAGRYHSSLMPSGQRDVVSL
ncbi:hypothetical protein F5Y05DRAFT_322100 [Hypoxylon sp. FL0543]|nr:hypothetical protein F5Y05DRAFT_322100 [Hypoxylon sp. FL0543]